MSTAQTLSQGLSSQAAFLQSDMNINDPAVLRKRIAELEMENKRLKDAESSSSSSTIGKGGFNTMRPGAANLAPPQ
jgi:hypothetical protein